MHSPLSLLTGLSLAVTIACTQSTYTIPPPPGPPPPGPPPPVPVTTTTINETLVLTCPVAPTVFINVTETEYIPLTSTTTAAYVNTATLPITIFQTIISTTVVTTTEIVTETSTTVSTTPTAATETATEIISVYEETSQATSITLCPTRLVNPTYTALGPYPTDWTWGCPPGWLCSPVQENCNFEAGIPDRNFYCSPNECILANALPATLPTWDVNIYGNDTPSTNSALHVNAIDHYFNINPEDFGLTYEIFVVNEVFTLTSTILLPPSPTIAPRQAQTSIPGACYPWCNNCLLEAQADGKTSALCVPGSAFEVSLTQCEQCIVYHKSDASGTFVEIAPQFQQFLDYCVQFSTIVVSTSVTATTTNAAGSSYSVVTGTLSTIVTPKSSPAPSPSLTQPSSVVTVVVSTLTSTPVPSTTLSSTSTPPAPISSGHPYTTTETVLTTTYSHSTVSGSAWSQITIIMPIGDNSTTTIYGSDLTSGGATLVLPTSPVTSTYTTTKTITTSGQVSAASTRTSRTASGASGTKSASASTFTGAATTLKFSAGEHQLQNTVLGLAVFMVAMLLL